MRGYSPERARQQEDIALGQDALSSEIPEFDEKVVDAWKKLQPNPEEFVSDAPPYTQADITGDKAYVEEHRAYLMADARADARAVQRERAGFKFENAFLEAAYDGEWFPGAEVTPTADYDDIRHGIDVVLSFEQDDGTFVHLGVDLTVSDKDTGVFNKLNESRKRMIRAEMSGVKYMPKELQSDVADLPSDKRYGAVMPRIIVGVNRQTAERLFNSVVDAVHKKAGAQKRLEQSPLAEVVRVEAMTQLVYFVEYAVDRLLKPLHGEKDVDQTRELRAAYNAVMKKSPDDVMGSEEFTEMCRILEQQEEVLRAVNPTFAPNVYVHLRALRAMERSIEEAGPNEHPEILEKLAETDDTIRNLTRPGFLIGTAGGRLREDLVDRAA